jgi:hypothetical protein
MTEVFIKGKLWLIIVILSYNYERFLPEQEQQTFWNYWNNGRRRASREQTFWLISAERSRTFSRTKSGDLQDRAFILHYAAPAPVRAAALNWNKSNYKIK